MIAVQRPAVEVVPNPARAAMVGTGLCLLTILGTAWTLLATGWVDGAGGSVVVAMAAVLEAAVLAYARVPRVMAIVLVPILALAAIIPATISALPFDGDQAFLHLIARYVSASFIGLSSTQDWAFTVGLCAVLWLCAYWMTWVALREHRGVLAVIPIYIVLATNVLNARAGHNPGLPTVLTLGFTLLVVANAHLDGLEARWQRTRVLPLPGIRSGMVGSTAVIAIGILVLGSVLPRATTRDISGQFFTTGGNGSGGKGSGGGDSGSGGPPSIGFSGITQPGGPLISNPKPVFTYTDDGADAPIYLRVINDTQFAAGNWYPDRSDEPLDNELGFVALTFDAGTLPRDSQPADGAVAVASEQVTTHILLKPGTTPLVQALFPGDPLRIDAAGSASGTFDANNGRGPLLTIDFVQLRKPLHPGTTLTSTGTVSAATTAQLRAAGTKYPEFVKRYTSLPDDDSHSVAEITALARDWTTGTTNPYDAATQIESHLRNPALFTYTLSPPSVPPGTWPIVYFLEQSHKGYCQYFASAMGAMLRSIGIPTRLVNGYGPGTPQTTSRNGQREQLVTTSDAHTWVEAYFPTYGWVAFEPTPASAQGDYVPIGRGGIGGGGAGNPDSDTGNLPGFSRDVPPSTITPPTPQGPQPSSAKAPDLHWVGIGILGFIGLALLTTLLWLLLPRTQRGAWRRLEAVGWALGLRRHADETHHAYANRFALATAPVVTDGDAVFTDPRRVRLRSAVTELAGVSAAREFARPGSTHEAPHARRLWWSVFRSAPALVYRSVRERLAPG